MPALGILITVLYSVICLQKRAVLELAAGVDIDNQAFPSEHGQCFHQEPLSGIRWLVE